MKNNLLKLLKLLIILNITACGTVSGLKNQAGEEIQINNYDKVVLGNFKNATDGQLTAADAKKVNLKFKHSLITNISNTKAFDEVGVKDNSREEALLIDGNIIEFEDGNAMARFMLGMGAGSSYFKSKLNFSDNATGEHLGSVDIALNSWPLGGAFAAQQTGEVLVDTAAEQIATDLAASKASSNS